MATSLPLTQEVLTDFRDTDTFLTVLVNSDQLTMRGWTSQETAELYARPPLDNGTVRLYRRTNDQSWTLTREFLNGRAYDV